MNDTKGFVVYFNRQSVGTAQAVDKEQAIEIARRRRPDLVSGVWEAAEQIDSRSFQPPEAK